MKQKIMTIFKRFLRGAIAGAVASMVGLQTMGVNSFSDIQTFKLIQSSSIFSPLVSAIYRFNTYPSEYLEKALRPPCN